MFDVAGESAGNTHYNATTHNDSHAVGNTNGANTHSGATTNNNADLALRSGGFNRL